MKKWFKKIGQPFLKKDEAKEKETTPTIEQKEIKEKETTPLVTQVEEKETKKKATKRDK